MVRISRWRERRPNADVTPNSNPTQAARIVSSIVTAAPLRSSGSRSSTDSTAPTGGPVAFHCVSGPAQSRTGRPGRHAAPAILSNPSPNRDFGGLAAGADADLVRRLVNRRDIALREPERGHD